VITLAGRSAATWWAVAALGTEYAVFLFGRHTDVRAPIVGAGLLALAELIHWSLRARSSARIETGMNLRHIDLGVPWLSSLALGLLIVVAGAISVHGGLPLAIAGVLGSDAVLGRHPGRSMPQTGPTTHSRRETIIARRLARRWQPALPRATEGSEQAFRGDPAGVGTAMITSRAVPTLLPAHIGVPQTPQITASQDFADPLVPTPRRTG
jgi:hypothetical protein